MDNASELEELYQQRFRAEDLAPKHAIWKVLCADFFQKYIRATDRVVDIGAGYCEFINNIDAREKIAVDLNPDVKQFAAPDVRVINAPCTAIQQLEASSVDIVFMSNFLEHLPTYREVLEILATSYHKLKPGGSVLILQPNYRLNPIRYFDAIDHTVILTDRNLVRALEALSFDIAELKVRFLPFTSKSILPASGALTALYLRLPPLQWLLGGQTFVEAVRPVSD